MTMDKLTISALAKAAGVGVETVRYYQRRGLIAEPPRSCGAIRRYDKNDVERLRFIRAAKKLGFSLNEIGELLKLESDGSCSDVKHLAQSKLDKIARQLDELQNMQKVLLELVSQCEASEAQISCPLISSLEQRSSIQA